MARAVYDRASRGDVFSNQTLVIITVRFVDVFVVEQIVLEMTNTLKRILL